MKIKNIVSFGALLLGLGSAQAIEITYSSPAFENVVTSAGTSLDSGFVFSIGSFGSFAPTAQNVDQWAANFTGLGAGAIWETDFTQFTQRVTLGSNDGVFASTFHAFIWGYNTQTLSSGTEWILFTNSAWLFPVSSGELLSWDVSQSGTQTVVGQLFEMGNNPYFVTAAVGPTIPEPSTYAAMVGAAALGLVIYRRRLKAVA